MGPVTSAQSWRRGGTEPLSDSVARDPLPVTTSGDKEVRGVINSVARDPFPLTTIGYKEVQGVINSVARDPLPLTTSGYKEVQCVINFIVQDPKRARAKVLSILQHGIRYL